MKSRWFFLFFFISGFCSLVYEIIWLRLSMAKFGVTTPMVSIVLSVFMAGLGLGSWGGGAVIRRFEKSRPAVPLRLYGVLELIIGCSAFLAPLLLDRGYTLLRDAGAGLAWGSSTYYLASGGWVAISLLPWCTCMGATFPFAMAAIRRIERAGSEHSFSYLYLANVLGAVLGTLVPAFVLIELYGFRGTLEISSALNMALALTVFLLSFAYSSRSAEVPEAEPVEKTIRRPSRAQSKTLLWLLFATGLCSMAMEVVWTRQFTPYLGNVVYAFATILALYLGATFAGSWVYRRWVQTHDPKNTAAAWIALGLLALLPVLFADPRFPLTEHPFTLLGFIYGFIRAALGVCPFSALVGFLTPMLVDRCSGGDPDAAGGAYAINVIGCILGPLLAGFGVLPWVSERWALCLISIPLFLIALAAAVRARHPLVRVFSIPAKPLYAACVTLSLVLAAFARDYDSKYPDRIELRDYTASVIATGEGMKKFLLVNGIGMTYLTTITKLMAHVPLAMLGRPAQNGLVICFGMGTTFRSMLTWGIDTTVVELVPSVPKLFGYFHSDGPELLKSPRAHVVIDDGRRFLTRSQQQFDVITLDPPPPISAPTSSLLYSEEFYAIIKRHLRAGGILQVWSPGGDPATGSAIAKALQHSFPHIKAYESIEGWGTHYFARMEPLPLMNKDLAKTLPPRAVADLIEWESDSTPVDIFDDLFSDEESIDCAAAMYPTVSPIKDDRPVNEYFLLRTIFKKEAPSVSNTSKNQICRYCPCEK